MSSQQPPHIIPPMGGMQMPPPGMMPMGMPMGMMLPPGMQPFQGPPGSQPQMGMMPPHHGMPMHQGMMGPPQGGPMRPQKVFFPHEIQVYFKERNVGFLKTKLKPKCRNIDPLTEHESWEYINSKFERGPPPQREKQEIPKEKRTRERREKLAKLKEDIKQKTMEWNPFSDENATSDPYRTLIVSNISYNINEAKLKEHFKMYGPVKTVRIVRNLNQKHRGYGFVEFERKIDFVIAYKNAHEKKLDGRRIGVDIERGRTILKFRPRRFGGGLGDSRKSRARSESLEDEDDDHNSDSDGEDRKNNKGARSASVDSRVSHHRDNGSRNRSRSNNIKKILSRSASPAEKPKNRSSQSPLRKKSRSPLRQTTRSPPPQARKSSKSPARKSSRSPLRREKRASPRRASSPQRNINGQRNSSSPLRRGNGEPLRRVERSPVPVRRGSSRSPPQNLKRSKSREGKVNKKDRKERSRSRSQQGKREELKRYDDVQSFRKDNNSSNSNALGIKEVRDIKEDDRSERKDKKSKKDSRKSTRYDEEGEVDEEDGEWGNEERDRKKKKKDKKEEKRDRKEEKQKDEKDGKDFKKDKKSKKTEK